MTDGAIDHIVFDIGRVLLHWDPELPYRHLIPDEGKRRWFFDNVCTTAWNLEQDRGRDWREAERVLIAEHPGHEAEIVAFRRHWHEMVPHALEDSVAILRTLLGQGRDVTLLTNFAADTLQEARGRFGFLNEPRGITVSGEVGFLKPDREIYESHAARFGIRPQATLFIDDSAANVEGARTVGWRAVQFSDAPTLRRDLGDFGIAV